MLVCCLFLIIGCSEDKMHHEPPPGYSIVCDNQGHFGVRNDVIGYIFEDYYGANNEPPKTRQGAIDRAWDQYEYAHRKKEVPKKYDWRECKER